MPGHTYKQKFNKKYKQKPNQSNSIEDISKLSGFKLKGLKKIFEKGEGAFFSSPGSVRPSVKSPQQWAYGRLYSAVMGGAAAKVDKDLLIKK
jgi:hypothetical protein